MKSIIMYMNYTIASYIFNVQDNMLLGMGSYLFVQKLSYSLEEPIYMLQVSNYVCLLRTRYVIHRPAVFWL